MPDDEIRNISTDKKYSVVIPDARHPGANHEPGYSRGYASSEGTEMVDMASVSVPLDCIQKCCEKLVSLVVAEWVNTRLTIKNGRIIKLGEMMRRRQR